MMTIIMMVVVVVALLLLVVVLTMMVVMAMPLGLVPLVRTRKMIIITIIIIHFRCFMNLSQPPQTEIIGLTEQNTG